MSSLVSCCLIFQGSLEQNLACKSHLSKFRRCALCMCEKRKIESVLKRRVFCEMDWIFEKRFQLTASSKFEKYWREEFDGGLTEFQVLGSVGQLLE